MTRRVKGWAACLLVTMSAQADFANAQHSPQTAASGNTAASQNAATNRSKTEEKPALVKFGGSDGSSLKFESGTAQFTFPLRIQSAGQAAVGVKVELNPLWGPYGKQVELKCEKCSKPIDVAKGQAVELPFSGTLGGIGTYTGWVGLAHADQFESKLVEIKRVLRDPTFRVTGGEQATEGELTVSVVDETGEDTRVLRPEVLSLTRSQKNKPATQARYEELQVLNKAGEKVGSSFALSASQPTQLKLRFVGLEPGEYAGKLQFIDERGSKPREFEIKQLSTRWSIWCALIPILFGAVASHFLREWSVRYRPLLTRRRDVADVAAILDETEQSLLPVDEEERLVIVSLRHQLAALERSIDIETLVKVDAGIETMRAKLGVLGRWMVERRRIARIEPQSLRQEFQASLQAGKDFFTNPQALATDPAVQTIKDIEGKVTQKIQTELTRLKSELEKQVRDQINRSMVTQAQQLQTHVLPMVERIDSTLPTAMADLKEARTAFARALVDSFLQGLNGPAPAGVEATDWVPLQKKLEPVLSAARDDPSDSVLTETYRMVLRDYAKALLGAFSKALVRRSAILAAANLGAGKAGFQQRLATLEAKLAAIELDVQTPDKWPDAAARLQDLGVEVRTFDDDYETASGQQMSTTGAPARAPGQVVLGSVPEGLRIDAAQPPPPVRGARQVTTWRPGQWIRTGDAAITLAAGLIALLLGLQTVWSVNPGWGGFDDMLTALLWGLGLHQGASGVFEGIAGIKRRYG